MILFEIMMFSGFFGHTMKPRTPEQGTTEHQGTTKYKTLGDQRKTIVAFFGKKIKSHFNT